MALAEAIDSSGLSLVIGGGLATLAGMPIWFVILLAMVAMVFLGGTGKNTAMAAVFLPVAGACDAAIRKLRAGKSIVLFVEDADPRGTVRIDRSPDLYFRRSRQVDLDAGGGRLQGLLDTNRQAVIYPKNRSWVRVESLKHL